MRASKLLYQSAAPFDKGCSKVLEYEEYIENSRRIAERGLKSAYAIQASELVDLFQHLLDEYGRLHIDEIRRI